MPNQCPVCRGKGTIASDCPYCRDSEAHEHHDLARKTCACCGSSGLVEEVCPACNGVKLGDQYRKVS